MINNEAQLTNTLETLLRLGVDYFGILSHYDRILVALSALYTYSDKMRKCVTVDDLLAHISTRCDIDPVSDALQSITTNKGNESRGVNDYIDTVADGDVLRLGDGCCGDDGIHLTIKKRGRIDIENKWANDYEDYWVNAVKSNNDPRGETLQTI